MKAVPSDASVCKQLLFTDWNHAVMQKYVKQALLCSALRLSVIVELLAHQNTRRNSRADTRFKTDE